MFGAADAGEFPSRGPLELIETAEVVLPQKTFYHQFVVFVSANGKALAWEAKLQMDFAEQVKGSVDIVKTIGEYVPLKKAGAGPRYTGLCPFHSEKTPSFSVHGGHQFYKCFGCGVGGDVFKFVMEIEGLPFQEALKLLAERNGIPVPQRTGHADASERLRAAIAEMHEIAWDLFQTNLRSAAGAEARAYLAGRGVSEALWSEFGLGLASPSGQQLNSRLEQRGYGADVLEKSGLVRKRQEGSGFYDYFRNRLMFPIHNETGKVIAFGGRALRAEDQPKYLNSPETEFYRKAAVLYNLHRARHAIRKQERSVLVEGYMDVIGVWSAGVQEVVASCGTALTDRQVRTLRRYSERVVVNFDPDTAGANATERSLQLLLEENMSIRVLELDHGLDPDEYVKRFGEEQYRAKLNQASGYFHWLADRARRKFDMSGIEGRLEGWKFLWPAIQRIPDKLERMAVANDIASYLGVDRALVLEQFRRGDAGRRPQRNEAPVADTSVPSVERLLLKSLAVSPEARRDALPKIKRMGLADTFVTRGIFEALFAMPDIEDGFRFDGLEARLTGPDRARLANICLADEGIAPEAAYDQTMECLTRLQNGGVDVQRLAIKNQIREAERSGDFAEAVRLAGELSLLPRG
jgi:DNA primase